MTSRLQFRNVDVDPGDPVETWPTEAVQAALERGTITDWRRLTAAIRRDPYGSVARRVEHVLTYCAPYGVAALMRSVIARARQWTETQARDEVRRRLADAVRRSGLTQAQFAQRLGTSPSRLSTYLSGKVDPSASLLVRAERLVDGLSPAR